MKQGKQKYNLKDWWKSAVFLGLLAVIEVYASYAPGPHK